MGKTIRLGVIRATKNGVPVQRRNTVGGPIGNKPDDFHLIENWEFDKATGDWYQNGFRSTDGKTLIGAARSSDA